ncbi:sulfatase family protein [Pseudemcibacter sp.]|uniref:sulfatase family protein n=1 Tax=Pseudemcibacter sp. TaxID=2943293 RepID=UPI003F6A520D
MNKKVNFLYIMVDQARSDFFGCYGNDKIKTPNIDALAKRGTTLDQLYVANPFCMPSRSAIMTGRMPSVNGARTNGTPLPLEARTFVGSLLDDGYDTALIGKCHLQNMTGMERAYTPPEAEKCKTDEDGYPDQPTTSKLTGADYENENSVIWRASPDHEVKTPYYGFDHVDLCTLHSDNVGANYERWLNEEVSNENDLKGAKNGLDKGNISSPQSWRTAIDEEHYSTSYIGRKTIDWIEEHQENASENPFFLHCSFPDPHHPFAPPGKYWDMYDPDDMNLPESFNKGSSPVLDHMRNDFEQGTSGRESTLPFAVNEKEAREAIALTYGMVTMIDDWVGKIMASLEEQGLLNNTVIIFSSDHGEYMANHGIMLKGPLHYQGLIRIPFIWCDPVQNTLSRTSELCSAIDIAPTILERSQTKPYYGIQGKSMLDMMNNKIDHHRKAVLIEDDREVIYLGFKEPQRVRTMVTDRYRLSMTQPADFYELYDLKNDPHEINNLWEDDNQATLRNQEIQRMLKLICEMQDWSPLPTGRA